MFRGTSGWVLGRLPELGWLASGAGGTCRLPDGIGRCPETPVTKDREYSLSGDSVVSRLSRTRVQLTQRQNAFFERREGSKWPFGWVVGRAILLLAVVELPRRERRSSLSVHNGPAGERRCCCGFLTVRGAAAHHVFRPWVGRGQRFLPLKVSESIQR
jgi:hypothetical protein